MKVQCVPTEKVKDSIAIVRPKNELETPPHPRPVRAVLFGLVYSRGLGGVLPDPEHIGNILTHFKAHKTQHTPTYQDTYTITCYLP